MKCHYTYDTNGERFFIPMCYGSMYEDDKDNCTCPDPLTVHQFEKKRFNQVLKQKNTTIADQQSEIKSLNTVIKSLKKKYFTTKGNISL